MKKHVTLLLFFMLVQKNPIYPYTYQFRNGTDDRVIVKVFSVGAHSTLIESFFLEKGQSHTTETKGKKCIGAIRIQGPHGELVDGGALRKRIKMKKYIASTVARCKNKKWKIVVNEKGKYDLQND